MISNTLKTEWYLSHYLVPYQEAITLMECRIRGVLYKSVLEFVWLLTHPPLYTAGTSACTNELLSPYQLPHYYSDRGGHYTYHGPGQRVIYIILNTKARAISIYDFIHILEVWVSRALAPLGVKTVQRVGRIGLWLVRDNSQEEKIAAIGIHLHCYISSHGIAINITTNLEDFSGIVPCGLTSYNTVSLLAAGIPATLAEVDWALAESFFEVFV